MFDHALTESVPLRLWVLPGARNHCQQMLHEHLPQAEIADILNHNTELCGPATLVMHTDDLRSPRRGSFQSLAQRALPGNPS